FQAEDGIRDATVTGVQTCALPIYQTGVRVLECMHDELKTQMDGAENEGCGIVRLEWRGLAPKGRGVEAEGARLAADPVASDDLGVKVERDDPSGEERGGLRDRLIAAAS